MDALCLILSSFDLEWIMLDLLGEYLKSLLSGLGSLRHCVNKSLWFLSEGGTSLSISCLRTGVASLVRLEMLYLRFGSIIC